MDTTWDIQNSIYLLNDFCADAKSFSFSKLATLKLKGLVLHVDTVMQELTIVISTEQDYQALQWHLMPARRLYQLLGIHFKKVHIVFGPQDEPLENDIYLETVSLMRPANKADLRDANSLGSRLRRTLNVALQGHIGVLRLYDDNDADTLRALWERGRITQLIEKYSIVPFDDASGEIIKLWKPRRLKSGEEIVVIID